eukprot:Gb_18709 [translate_table: standard]
MTVKVGELPVCQCVNIGGDEEEKHKRNLLHCKKYEKDWVDPKPFMSGNLGTTSQPMAIFHHLILLDMKIIIDTIPETGKKKRRYLVYNLMMLNQQPVESISTINNYLATYRLPTFQEISPLLILMHQHKEANSVKAQHTELQNYFGTPLIAPIGQDVKIGVDIQAIVQALLTPMLRYEHSSHGSHAESPLTSG